MSKTLVIGDCHGHHDRLEALLEQEGIIKDGKRVPEGPQTVHLGDLGHFGWDTKDSDQVIYERALEWLDLLLWGNHDRAVISHNHHFMGYSQPHNETIDIMEKLHDEERYEIACVVEGKDGDFLLTHAGVHKWFKQAPAPEDTKVDPKAFAEWINLSDTGVVPVPSTAETLINAIGYSRGGRETYGGVLWRDASESLYEGFRQIFGHSSGKKVRTYQTKAGDSYCIDVGDKDNGRLAGIWLPEERIVEVNLGGS